MIRRGLLALIAMVSVAAGCCPIRKGVVLRGDWSLELNRVPWRTGCDSSCYESSGDGCTAGRVRGGATSIEEIPTPSPSGAAHARFHAVPTRPVFGESPNYDEPVVEARRPKSKQANSILRPASRPKTRLEPTPADRDDLAQSPNGAARRQSERAASDHAEAGESRLVNYEVPEAEQETEVRRATPVNARRSQRSGISGAFEPQWRARGSI